MPITISDILNFQAKKTASTLILDGNLTLVNGISLKKFDNILTEAIRNSRFLQHLVLMENISEEIAKIAINAINKKPSVTMLTLRGKKFSISTAVVVLELLKTNQYINQLCLINLSEDVQIFLSKILLANFSDQYRLVRNTNIINNLNNAIYYTAHVKMDTVQDNRVQHNESFSEDVLTAGHMPLPQQNHKVKSFKSKHAGNIISCRTSGETKEAIDIQNDLSTNCISQLVTLTTEPPHKHTDSFVNMPTPSILSALFAFRENKAATTLLLSERICDLTVTPIVRESLRVVIKAIVSCNRLQQLILHNNVDKDMASVAIAYYRGKLLTLSGQALGSETARTIMNAISVNRHIYQLNLQDIKEPVLANIYDMFTADFIATPNNIREIYCNNNTNYGAKFAQFIQNILRQEVTALINGASNIRRYKGKSLFTTLSPASASLTADKIDTSSRVFVKK